MRLWLFAALLLLPTLTRADECLVRVQALDIVIDSEQFEDDDLTPSKRETLLNWPSRVMDKASGHTPACTSDVTLTFMASLNEVYTSNGYCLEYVDDEVGYIMLPGDRNFRGRCTKTTCERLTGATEDLAAINDRMTSVFGEAPTLEEMARAETPNAMLVQGTDRFIRSKLNATASTALLTALGAPHIATASALTVVAVGGTSFLCAK